MVLRAVAASVAGEGSSQSQFSSSAFASLPAAASSTGLIYSISDAGDALFRSNGTIWKPVGGVATIATSAAGLSVPGDTTEDTLVTVTIPAGIMGTDGTLVILTSWTMTNGADDKIPRVRFSGGAGTVYLAPTITASASANYYTAIQNRGAANSQIGTNGASNGSFGSSTTAQVTSAVDTTAATTVVITGQKETLGDTLTLNRYTVQLLSP